MSVAPEAAISNVTEDVGASTLRVGTPLSDATVFVRCVARADFAVPEECDDDDDDALSADADGAVTMTAAPTPSATASPPT